MASSPGAEVPDYEITCATEQSPMESNNSDTTPGIPSASPFQIEPKVGGAAPTAHVKSPYAVTVEDADEDDDDNNMADNKYQAPCTSVECSETASDTTSWTKSTPDSRATHTASQRDPPTTTTTSPVSPVSPSISPIYGPLPRKAQIDALKYLDEDSPEVTPEAVRRSIDGAISPHPANVAGANHPWVAGSHLGSILSQNMPYREPAIIPRAPPSRGSATSFPSEQHRGPTVPMPHSTPGLQNGVPQINQAWPPSPRSAFSHPRAATVGMQSPFLPPMMHPHPINQKPPLSGYSLLSLKLAGSIADPHAVTPIYRRFEAISHRLLLQLQDEICELEQQLESIDADEARSRHGPTGVAPASRRGQSESGWYRDQALGMIGWKLRQYNDVMTSLKGTQLLPSPSAREIEDYRALLAHGCYIAEAETHFLDTNDLVSLPTHAGTESHGEASSPTVRSRQGTPTLPSSSAFDLLATTTSRSAANGRHVPAGARPSTLPSPVHLTYATMVATLVPILAFAIVPGFTARLIVVALIFLGAVAAIWHTGVLDGQVSGQTWQNYLGCSLVYAAVMVGVAGVMHVR